ncbi:MAG: 2-hydroxychromene-2-carboxylate isomerase [Pseudomonadota bacterium]
MATPRLEFWFEFASTYAYLSAMRIEARAAAHGVEVTWRPFLLGPIFASQGWETSPFNIYPAKGAYMWRDVARQARAYGVAFAQPEPFPQHTLLAARVAVAALRHPGGTAYCRAIFEAQFADGKDIADPDTVAGAVRAAGLPDGLVDAAAQPEIKDALRVAVAQAQALGIFGAPSFVANGELFWGDDRLEQALEWAVAHPG